MEPELMADAFDDLRDDYITRAPKPPRVGVPEWMLPAWLPAMRAGLNRLLPLDPAIAELCDACPAPVAPALAHRRVAYAIFLLATGMTALFYTLGWTHEHAAAWGTTPTSEADDEPTKDERIYTGYMPPEQRKNVRHRLYRDKIRKPPPRETLAEKVAREASEKWGHA